MPVSSDNGPSAVFVTHIDMLFLPVSGCDYVHMPSILTAADDACVSK